MGKVCTIFQNLGTKIEKFHYFLSWYIIFYVGTLYTLHGEVKPAIN